MQATAFIFARGGSKGVPGKNIRPLAGKPLIRHAIDAARACPSVGRVIVSTDDPQIADIARQGGADVPFLRPAELARDDSPEWLAWQHAIRAVEAEQGFALPGAFVSVPATSPLRAPDDVEACIRMLETTDADAIITVTPARRSPLFNMVVLGEDGTARLAMAPAGRVVRRQDAPRVFDITTVAYAARPAFVLRVGGIFDGKVRAVVVPEERAIDIDTELDFRIAEVLLASGKGPVKAA